MRSFNKVCVSLMVCMALSLGVHAEIVGRITYIEGRVDCLKDEAIGFTPGVIGQEMSVGDRIRTKSYSKAEVSFKDGSLIRIGGSSCAAIDRYELDNSGARVYGAIELDRGQMRAIVAKGKKSTPFDITTPNCSGTVMGSDVFIAFQRSSTSVLVAEGTFKTFNPEFPKEIVDVKRGKYLYLPHNAPPGDARVYLPMEKRSFESDTSPTVREIQTRFKDARITRALIVKLSGNVLIMPGDSKRWHTPVMNEVLNAGDKIVTEKNGRVEIALDNGHLMELRPKTQLMIKKLAKNAKTGDYDNLFECAYGKIRAKLVKVKDKSSFKVKTPTAICGVRGTIMYLVISRKLTKAFFEGGGGFIANLRTGDITNVDPGMSAYVGADGNVSDPKDTTDQERSEFGSDWGSDSGNNDEYGYSKPDGTTAGEGTDVAVGDVGGDTVPEGGAGTDNTPFEEIKPDPGTTPAGTIIDPSVEVPGAVTGNFKYQGRVVGSVSDGISNLILPEGLWSGTAVTEISGSYSFDDDMGIMFGRVNGSGMNGSYSGYVNAAAGYLTGDDWRGAISALYINSDGEYGLLFGPLAGIHDESNEGVFSGSGMAVFIPMGTTDIDPNDLTANIIEMKQSGIMDAMFNVVPNDQNTITLYGPDHTFHEDPRWITFTSFDNYFAALEGQSSGRWAFDVYGFRPDTDLGSPTNLVFKGKTDDNTQLVGIFVNPVDYDTGRGVDSDCIALYFDPVNKAIKYCTGITVGVHDSERFDVRGERALVNVEVIDDDIIEDNIDHITLSTVGGYLDCGDITDVNSLVELSRVTEEIYDHLFEAFPVTAGYMMAGEYVGSFMENGSPVGDIAINEHIWLFSSDGSMLGNLGFVWDGPVSNDAIIDIDNRMEDLDVIVNVCSQNRIGGYGEGLIDGKDVVFNFGGDWTSDNSALAKAVGSYVETVETDE